MNQVVVVFSFKFVAWSNGILIGNHFREWRRVLVANGRVQAYRGVRGFAILPDPAGSEVQVTGNFFVGRLALQRFVKPKLSSANVGHMVGDIHWQANGL